MNKDEFLKKSEEADRKAELAKEEALNSGQDPIQLKYQELLQLFIGFALVAQSRLSLLGIAQPWASQKSFEMERIENILLEAASLAGDVKKALYKNEQ